MRLSDYYAQYSGVEPEKPEFPSVWTARPDHPYFTVCTGASTQSRIYSYWNKVISLLDLPLRAVQIGAVEDYPIVGAIDYRGQLNLRQEGFLIDGAQFHIGNDHVFNNLAEMADVHSFSVHAVLPGAAAAPRDHTYISAPTKRPSYTDKELPKSIDLIKPETIANAILVKNGKEPLSIETVRIGPAFLDERIDLIPDFPIPPNTFSGRKIVCRFDICPNRDGLIHFLNCYGGPVFTYDPIDPQIMQNFKARIPHVVYYVDRNLNVDFVRYLAYSGIAYDLVSSKTGKELSDLKLELFDFNQIKSPKKHDISDLTEDMKFETNRVFFSRNQFYPSKYHWEKGQPIQSCDFSLRGIETDSFQESMENLYIYKK
jgi:hypothetical protein